MPHPLERRIAELQRHATRLLAWYGLSWVAVCVIGAVLVLGTADYLIRFQDRGIRLMCSLAIVAVMVRAVWQFAWQPLRRRLSAVEVAQRVERRFPQLKQELSSSIEFLSRSAADQVAGSAALRRAVIQQAESDTDQLDLSEALERRPTRRAVALALTVCAVAALTAIVSPGSAALALARLVKPLGSEVWPRENDLVFLNAPSRLAVGQTFEVELKDRLGRSLPDEVRIHYRFENESGPLEEVESMHLLKGLMVARRENVSRPFQYRAEGGDDQSMPWTRLEVVEPPRVESFKIRLTPPAYTGWPAEFAERQIQALRGTRLEFTGAATKRLKTVAWRQEEGATAAGAVGEDQLSFRVPAAAMPPLVVDKSGAYWFELVDSEGLTGGTTDRWEIRAIADQPPSVAIEQPVGNLFVTAVAVLPLKIAVKDDLAVRDAVLRYVRSDRSDAGEVSIELFRGPSQVAPQPEGGPAAANASGDSRLIEYAWSLADLKLKPGAQLTFYAAASDYLPQQGQSTARKVTIITEQELEDRLAQRQTLILGELSRALKLQQETRGQTTSLEIQLRDVGRLQKQDIDHAQAAELNQRQVTRALTSDHEGVPAHIKDLLSDLESNRVDSPDLRRRMESLLDEIGRLEEEHLGTIERELTSAIKGAQSQPAASKGSAKDSGKPGGEPAKAGQTGQPSGPDRSTGADKPKEAGKGNKDAASPHKDDKPSDLDKPAGHDKAQSAPAQPREQPPGDPVARSLATAGEHQDEVIGSLESMLGQLSKWDNYRRFAREVAQVRRDQEDVLLGTQQLGAKTLSRDFKDLEPQQQADLKKLANRQHDLARQFDKLQQQMQDAGQRLKEEDPLAAETIGDALDLAQKRGLSGRMREAGDQAQRNQVSQAIGEQQQIAQELDELLNILSNRREQELSRLVRKLREAERDLQQLRKQQAGLRKKMDEAAAAARDGKLDAQEHKRQIERLMREERRLQEEAARLARRLERLQAEQAGRKMGAAASRLGQAGQAGEKGDAGQAGEQAEAAEKDLEEAQVELAKRRQQAEADLANEQLSRIEDTVKSLHERQGKLIDETRRLEGLREAKGYLTRGEAASLQDLVRQQRALQQEAHLLAEKIAGAETFHLALNNAGEDMLRAANRLSQRDTGVGTQRIQRDAQDRIAQMLAALKSDSKKGGKPGSDGNGQGGGQGGQQGGGIRSIAEVKLLKLMQEDLNLRLKTLGDAPAESDREAHIEQLTRLSVEQGQLADLALKLSRPLDSNVENEPEKLPDVRRDDQLPEELNKRKKKAAPEPEEAP